MSTATAFTDSMADNEASAHPENLRATDIKALLRDFIDSIPEEKLLRLREGCSYSPIYHDGNFGLLKRWVRTCPRSSDMCFCTVWRLILTCFLS
jgi:hypothetical protein